MGARAWIFAALLLVSSGLVVAGVAAWSEPAGLVVGGVLLAVWGWLVLGDLPTGARPADWRPAAVEDIDT